MKVYFQKGAVTLIIYVTALFVYNSIFFQESCNLFSLLYDKIKYKK